LATFAELDEADPAGVDRLARASRRAGDVVRLHRAFRGRVARWATPHDQVVEAAAAVDASADLRDVGTVVLHLPRRLRTSEVAFLAALSRRERLRAIVGVETSSHPDEPAVDVLRLLEPLLGPGPPVASALASAAAPTPTPTAVEVARAIDPAEEARTAVRRVVAALEAGVPADRVAVVARVRQPYHLLLHEELEAAGITHRAPATHTLAQSVAGRTLLGLLDLAADGLRRPEVMAWLRSAPILDPVSGRPVPAPWWDRLAREAGVAGGIDQWHTRLARAAERRAERHAEADDSAEPDRKAVSLAELAAFIDDLAARLERPAPKGDTGRAWRRLAAWATGLLDAYLDRRSVAAVPAEQGALDAIEAMLDELAGLDGVGPSVEPGGFTAVVATHLDRPAASSGTLGRGVIVGSLADLVGADLDLAIIVGAAEGVLPPARLDDPLLPNRERRTAAIQRRGLSPAEEHRDLIAALASARETLITTPRADPRSQREVHPARWLLDLVGDRLGRVVTGADLDTLADDPNAGSWFSDVVSFEWWLAAGRSPATAHEHDVAQVLTARRAGLDARQSSPAQAHPMLARGLTALAARRHGGFGPWTGLAGPRADFLSDLSHPQSSTALEHWVVCPFRYFLGHVLRVDEHDDPADADWVSAMTRGSLYHAVLEQFVAEAIDRPPDRPWHAAERERLHEIADDVGGVFDAEGRTGRPLLWELARHDIHRQLDRILDDDDRHRAQRKLIPVAVEHGFGFDDTHPPVRVDAGEGQEVVFRGFIDRIDRTTDGDRLVVLDYKTGSPFGYPDGRSGDLTANGRYLQLLVYAAAARAAYGDVPVESYYWFVGERDDLQLRGGEVDEAAEARLREVLGVLVDGVGGGKFPARPGQENYFRGFDNCRWCPYDRVCGTDRAEQWQRVRGHRGLTAYRELVEPEPDEVG
ncbi:MAG: PD-(D/E)XK nuclease family protein, partial [Acidimicrobiales bacterium]